MKKAYSSLQKDKFHLSHWKLSEHRRLSLLLLLFLLLHAAAVMGLRVQFPSESRVTSLRTPTLQVFWESMGTNSGKEIAFQLRYQDPSSVSKSSLENLSFLPRDVSLKVGLELESLTKTLTPSDFLTSFEAPSLIEKVENSLREPLLWRTAQIETNNGLTPPQLGGLTIGEAVAHRLTSALPVLSTQITDRPLLPTVIRAAVSPNGVVESALVEASSGNLSLDKQAAQISTRLRFLPDFEKETIWSPFTFYWPQTSAEE